MSQITLPRSARLQNLRKAFALRAPQDIVGKRILLIDDVFTTGATLHAAAEALHRAGVTRIDAWVCARVL